MHASVLEGAVGGVPSPGVHFRYTASQMRAFTLASRSIMEPFIHDANEPVWVSWVRSALAPPCCASPRTYLAPPSPPPLPSPSQVAHVKYYEMKLAREFLR